MMKRMMAAICLGVLGGAINMSPAQGSIYGTMSNFDVYNETPHNSYGAEIELEGIYSSHLSRTFPAHYNSKTVTEYNEGGTYGVRIKYSGYNYGTTGYLAPTVGLSTNGHTCVGTPGCEHFGFSTVGTQPTAARYYWLDQSGARIGNSPMQVPTPTWTYIPPANPGDRPDVVAEVEPVDVEELYPDSIWVKIFKTEIERPVELAELMSGNGIVPEDVGETETEWDLLEKGRPVDARDNVEDGSKSIIRRYEYFEYTGPYTDENEPISSWDEIGDPPANELGQFIAANMVAANLEAPARTQGDYNDDGVVNAADYVMWRKHHGSEIEHHPDGDDNGIVDDDDYGVWNGAFGNVLDGGGGPAAAAADAAVPEPAAVGMTLVGAAIAWLARARDGANRRGRRV